MVLLLVSVTLVVHRFHLLDPQDEFFARTVAAERQPLPEEGRPANDDLQVQVIELGAVARSQLEQEGRIADDTLQRLEGVRPIDRSRMAKVLQQLADTLDQPRSGGAPGNQPKVIAIDIDLAPLEDTPDCVGEHAVIDALDRLRKHADVAVIALDRATEPARDLRNQFMVNAGCRRATDAGTPASVRCPRLATPTTRVAHRADHPKSLYFASPRLFATEGAATMKFLTERRQRPAGRTDPLPARYPSLGTLVHLSALGSGLKPDEVAALTALCDQAYEGVAHRRGAMLLEDLFSPWSRAPIGPLDVARDYRDEWLNWRLLGSPRLQRTIVPKVEDLPKLAAAVVAAGALVVSVEGGGRDLFEVPSASADVVSGATLHALQALSLSIPLKSATLRGASIDAALGILFVLAALLAKEFTLWLQRFVPALGGWAHLAAPLLIATGLAFFAVHISAFEVNHDRWVNPMFVIAGLTLHAYLERDQHADEPWWHPLTFGAMRVQRALRRHRSGIGSAVKVYDASLVFALYALTLGAGLWVLVSAGGGH
ncbi:MAG TPA: hypothetical protein VFZ93_11930 [Albitalea sp.]